VQPIPVIGDSYRQLSAVRPLTRPLLTILLWRITSLVWSGAASDEKAGKVETSNFAAKAATLWWFADRGHRRQVR
jgi:hypothetical protein